MMFRRYLYHYHPYRDLEDSFFMSVAAAADGQPAVQATGNTQTSSNNLAPETNSATLSKPTSNPVTPDQTQTLRTTSNPNPTTTPNVMTTDPGRTSTATESPTTKPVNEPRPSPQPQPLQSQPQPENSPKTSPKPESPPNPGNPPKPENPEQPKPQPPAPAPTQSVPIPQNNPQQPPETQPEQNAQPIVVDTSPAPPRQTLYTPSVTTTLEPPMVKMTTTVEGFPTVIVAPKSTAPKSMSLLVATGSLSTFITSPHLSSPTASITLAATPESSETIVPSPNSSTMSASSKASLIIGVVLLLGAGCLLYQLFIRNKKDERRRSTDDNEKLTYREMSPSRASSSNLPANYPHSDMNPKIAPSVCATIEPRREAPNHTSENNTNPFGNQAEIGVNPVNASGPGVIEKAMEPPPMARFSSQKGNSQPIPPSPSGPPYSNAMNPNNLEKTPNTVFSSGTQDAKMSPVNDKKSPPNPQTMAVHRVQLAFTPSMDDELELRCGQLIRLLHEFDDGWAMCIRMDGSEQGVCPRTCLSAQPLKPQSQNPNNKGSNMPSHASNMAEGSHSNQREPANKPPPPADILGKQSEPLPGQYPNKAGLPGQVNPITPVNAPHQLTSQPNPSGNGPFGSNSNNHDSSKASFPVPSSLSPNHAPQPFHPGVNATPEFLSPNDHHNNLPNNSQSPNSGIYADSDNGLVGQDTDYFSYDKNASNNSTTYPSIKMNDASAYPAPLQKQNSGVNNADSSTPFSPTPSESKVVPGQAL